MPRLSSWFVRASLIYLAISYTLGDLLLVNKGWEFYPPIWGLLPYHVEVLLMGWFVQLAVEMAYWILPRLSGASPRGNLKLVGLSFGLINMGILLVVIEAVTSIQWLWLIGRLSELGGVLLFVDTSWKRVKTFGR